MTLIQKLPTISKTHLKNSVEKPLKHRRLSFFIFFNVSEISCNINKPSNSSACSPVNVFMFCPIYSSRSTFSNSGSLLEYKCL